MKKTYIKYPYLTKDAVIYERENGHKIVLAHKDGELVNISTWVKTGSINENDKNNGISHFLEHLMFKGTHKHKAGYFDRTLEAKGAIVNAATWKDYTFFYVTLPKGKNDKDLYLALELHADMMMDPVMPDDEIGLPFDLNSKNVGTKRERHVVIEEIRMRKDQPWTKVYNTCNFNMYTKHPYKRDVIGTPEIISKVTREQIMDYYKTFYTPKNMTTIIVGDFDEEKVLNAIDKSFDFGERKNPRHIKRDIDKPVGKTLTVEEKSMVNSGYAMLGWLGPKAENIKETIYLDMISIILGEGTSSRLYQHLIEKQKEQVFYIVESEHYQFKDGDNFFVQANFAPDKKDKAIKLLTNEMKKLITNKITKTELLKAKKKIKSRLACASETVSDIGETIGYYTTVCDDLTLIEEYNKDLAKTTVEDLEKTVSKYLDMKNAVISILMPES